MNNLMVIDGIEVRRDAYLRSDYLHHRLPVMGC